MAQDSIIPTITSSDDAGYILTNWTHRDGIPGPIAQPDTTYVKVIYRDSTEGYLLAKNVAWSQVHKFYIESKGEELCGRTKVRNEKLAELINFAGIKVPLKEIEFDQHLGVILPEQSTIPEQLTIPEQSTIAEQFPHYFKDVRHLDVIDIYRVLDLWEVKDNAIGHAIKKLLVAGGRGANDAEQDVREAMVSLQRWQEMQAENTTDESSEG